MSHIRIIPPSYRVSYPTDLDLRLSGFFLRIPVVNDRCPGDFINVEF